MNKHKENIAVSYVWLRRFVECSDLIGTEGATSAVWRFYDSLIDIGEDKLAIKTIVTDFINNVWRPKVNDYILEHIEACEGLEELEIRLKNEAEKLHIRLLFNFIIQTIQDSGIGWPTIEDEENFSYLTQTGV